MGEFADAIVHAIGERRQSILVAQSLAGFTAPLACERVPVKLLVLLNAMVPSPGESAGEWWTNTGHAQARVGYGEVDVLKDFFHDVPPEVTGEAMAGGVSEPSETLFRARWRQANSRQMVCRAAPADPTRGFTPARREGFRRIGSERMAVQPRTQVGNLLQGLAAAFAIGGVWQVIERSKADRRVERPIRPVRERMRLLGSRPPLQNDCPRSTDGQSDQLATGSADRRG